MMRNACIVLWLLVITVVKGVYGQGKQQSGSDGRSLPVWIQLLKEGNDKERRQAAQKIGKLGVKDPRTVPALVKALEDRDDFVRFNAVEALKELAPGSRAAIAALTKTLNDSEPSVRSGAVLALGSIGAPAINGLLQALRSKDELVRGFATSGLEHLGPDAVGAVPAVCALLRDPDRGARIDAARTLDRLGTISDDPDSKKKWKPLQTALKIDAAPALREALADRDASVRIECACALNQITGDDEQSLTVLIKETTSKNNKIRVRAIRSLLQFGRKAVRASPSLLAALKAKDPEVRASAMYALFYLGGPELQTAMPSIVQGLNDKADVVREASAHLLTETLPGDRTAIQLLTKALSDSNTDVRWWAARALGDIGLPAARGAIPQLKLLLKDRSPGVRERAAEALDQLME